MIKIIRLVILLFLVCFSEVFSQRVNKTTIFSNGFNWITKNSSSLIIYDKNKLSSLYNMGGSNYLASLKTYSNNLFITNSKNSATHHSLVFAKINFFGIENLEQRDDLETPFKEDDSSFWDNEIIYFVVGAVAATALYIVWQNSGSENPPQKTFGLPPKPKSVYGF